MISYPDDTFLARWLEGKLTPEELAEFEQSPDYPRLKAILAATDQFEAPHFDHQQLLAGVKNRLPSKQAKTFSIRPTWYLAAATILIGGLFLLWWLNRTDETVAPMVMATEALEQQEATLSDGSQVILKASSHLRVEFDERDPVRKLSLQGEAYLQVAKGKPFIVETPIGRVEVLGTAFTVKARESKGIFRVQCYEGTVAVSTASRADTLMPGEGLVWEAGSPTHFDFLEAQPNWLMGNTTLKEATLKEIIDEMERQFQVDLVPQGLDLERKLTITFPHDSLEDALDYLVKAARIDYRKRSDQEYILFQN